MANRGARGARELSVYTLRFYQRQRLLPSGEQKQGEVVRARAPGAVHRIRDLQEQGFSLAAIRVVLDETADPACGASS